MKYLSKNSFLSYGLIALFSINILSCKDDDEVGDLVSVAPTGSSSVTINMKQFVNGSALEMNTMNFPYTNALNQNYKVTMLQYLVSDFTFHKSDGSFVTLDNEYQLVDLSDSSSLVFTPSTKVPNGDYSSISFTFGFDAEDNVNSTNYPDLNLNWIWPSDPNSMFGNLGGGYHFMRLEGNYTSGMNSGEFKTHMGTARNTSTTPYSFVQNYLDITLANSDIKVRSDFSFDLEMNIEEWYQNPVTWDFEVWNAPIMPVYEAQRALNSNGANVFTIKK